MNKTVTLWLSRDGGTYPYVELWENKPHKKCEVWNSNGDRCINSFDSSEQRFLKRADILPKKGGLVKITATRMY